MKLISLFISIIILLVNAKAQESQLTLEEAIQITLINNYQIQIAQNDAELAKKSNTIGNAGFLPTIDANAGWQQSRQNTQQEFVSGDNQDIDGATRTSITAGVDLNWTLFDGTRMFATRNRLDVIENQSQWELRTDIESSVAQVMSIFIQASLEKERLSLFRSNLEFSEERTRIIKTEYEVGKASKLELLQAQVDENSDRSALISQEEALAAQKLELYNVMGVPVEKIAISHTLELDSSLVISELIDEAFVANPELKVLRLEKDISTLTLKELKADLLPTVDFGAGYDFTDFSSDAGFISSNRTSGVNYGFTARYNIFTGFRRKRDRQNALIQQENLNLQYAELERDIETRLNSMYLTYSNNIKLLRFEQQNVSIAKENVEIARERFLLGKTDPLEIREAQVNAINAEIRYLEAAYTAKLAEIELLRLAGKLVRE